ETVLVEQIVSSPITFGEKHKQEIAHLVDVANYSLLDWKDAKPRIEQSLKSSNPWERCWATIACGTFGKEAESLVPQVQPLLNDEELLVRVRAAEFLGSIQAVDPRPALYSVLKESKSPVTTLIALNAIVFLRDHHDYQFELQPKNITAVDSLVERRLDYLLGKRK
ncbi:MAG: HEAT repeat domain-containing protein, partial [Planctomycetaceae bacterium]|nr:HEAT repeat domain-containing protein [Planctomycetaceae bacterium]